MLQTEQYLQLAAFVSLLCVVYLITLARHQGWTHIQSHHVMIDERQLLRSNIDMFCGHVHK